MVLNYHSSIIHSSFLKKDILLLQLCIYDITAIIISKNIIYLYKYVIKL